MPEVIMEHRRLPNWELFDRIVIEPHVRFKDSGISGGEWRTRALVRLFVRGVEVYATTYHDQTIALAFLPSLVIQASEGTLDDVDQRRVSSAFANICDQPGCHEQGKNKLRLLKLYTNDGRHEIVDADHVYFRRFCDEHKERGDSSMEDCDSNYVVVL